METSVSPSFWFCSPHFFKLCAQHLSWILQGSQTCSALTQSPDHGCAIWEEKYTRDSAARIPIAQARWTSVCLPLPRAASPVPWSWGTLEQHPYCGWEENHDDVSSCLQTGKLVSSLLPNNEADRRDLHIWKQSGRKLFCSTFTYLPSSARAARGNSPVPCCWAAWLCTAWAQSMRWEMTRRRGQTPVSPVPTSGTELKLNYKAAETCRYVAADGFWRGTVSSSSHINHLPFTAVHWYGWSA